MEERAGDRRTTTCVTLVVLTLPYEESNVVSLDEVIVFSHFCTQFLTLHSAVTSERRSSCSDALQVCKLQPRLYVRTYSSSKTARLIFSPRCISVGTRKGYSITNCDPFGRVYTMTACVISLGHFIWSASYSTPKKYRRWCTRDRRDAVFYVTYRSCGRCGPAETADREHKGAPLLLAFCYHSSNRSHCSGNP